MAAAGPVQELCEELTCPVCLEYFKDPLNIAVCGHNFCRNCLARSWGEAGAEPSCPVCRRKAQPRDLRPNRQLANIVEIAKKFYGECWAERKRVEGQGGVCEKHREPLKLFCKDDEAPICVVCDRSKEHRDHSVIPVEEAAQKCKDALHGYTEILKKEREKILRHKADTKKQSEGLLERIELAREMSVAEFRKWHQFLEEQEQCLLAHMEKVEKEIARERDKQLAKLSRELSSLESFICEMQEKIQQPASEFLQDVKNILKRCDENNRFWNPVTFPQQLAWWTWDIWDTKCVLEAHLKKFKDILADQIQPQRAANVTLDPDTAHPKLILSQDRKSVRCPFDIFERSSGRTIRTVVLGREGFTSGRIFWEVTLGCKGGWAVGVARKPVCRKGGIPFSPREGIWSVGEMGGHCMALSDLQRCHFDRNGKPRRIRVALNFAGEQVDFFNADTAALLYRFSGASFHGEMLFPFFYVSARGSLSLSQNHSTDDSLINLKGTVHALDIQSGM